MIKSARALVIIFFLYNPVVSQTDSVHNFLIGEFRLYQIDSGREVYYDFDNEFNLVTVTDSFLISSPEYSYKTDLGSITRVNYHFGPDLSKMILYPGMAGFALGFLFSGAEFGACGASAEFDAGRGLLGGVLSFCIFGALGASIGVISSRNDLYVLEDKDIDIKRKLLMRSLKKNKLGK